MTVIVFPPETSFDSAARAIATLAKGLSPSLPPRPVEREGERLWADADPDARSLRLTRDQATGVVFLDTVGPITLHDTVRDRVPDLLAILSTDDAALALLDADDDALPAALLAYALPEPKWDERIADHLLTLLGHEQRAIRQGAAMAAYLLRWPPLAPPLAAAAAQEEDEALAGALRLAAATCDGSI